MIGEVSRGNQKKTSVGFLVFNSSMVEPKQTHQPIEFRTLAQFSTTTWRKFNIVNIVNDQLCVFHVKSGTYFFVYFHSPILNKNGEGSWNINGWKNPPTSQPQLLLKKSNIFNFPVKTSSHVLPPIYFPNFFPGKNYNKEKFLVILHVFFLSSARS
jgi:hypothetical protein